MDIKVIIKVMLIALLLGCLLKMPYGYYQFVRLVACIGFGSLVYYEYEAKHYFQVVFCIAAALLFNPLRPVYFKRDIWQIIDELIAMLLVIWVLIDIVMYLVKKRRKRNLI